MKKRYFFSILVSLFLSPLSFADHFYAGFQAGADFFSVKKELTSQVSLFLNPPIPSPHHIDLFLETKSSGTGGVGGLFLGYSWQFQDASLGVEVFGAGDGSRTTQELSNSGNLATIPFLVNLSTSERLKGFYGVAVRPGYLVNQRTRVYAKVGWARGRFLIDAMAGRLLGTTTFLTEAEAETAHWLSGWIAGLGTELFITPKLAINLEYNHIEYKKQRIQAVPTVRNILFGQIVQNAAIEYHPQSNNVVAGLTYYFMPQDKGLFNFNLFNREGDDQQLLDDGDYDAYAT